MYKEIIISIAIVILVIIGDILTQNFTKKTIENLCQDSDKLKVSLENKNKEETQQNLQELEKHIDEVHDSLAYYIEHDEIEKVETNFTQCKSFAEQEVYDFAINSLDKTVFVLEHITDKYSFSLENIF